MVDSDGSTNKPKQPSSISVIAEKKQKQKERNQLWTTQKVTKHILLERIFLQHLQYNFLTHKLLQYK